MITLKLANFRCYDQEQTFTFSCHQVIRLQGKSGIGKTTLFEAIQWVLYNYPTTNIYPRHGKSKETSVSLTLPYQKDYITIKRKKNPSLLILTFHEDKRREEDDVAQGTIESLFGSRDIWRTCCYLPQGEFSPLLGFSNLQRMEILETLSFLNSKPEEDLRKIEEEVRRLEIIHTSTDKELSLINSNISERQFPSSIAKLHLTDEKRHEIISTRQELKKKITSLEEQNILTREREKQCRLIKERIKKLEDQLNLLPDISSQEISSLEKEIKEYQEKLPYVKEKETYLTLLARKTALEEKINLLPSSDRNFTDEEYYDVLHHEKKIHDEEKIAEGWKVKYQEKKVQVRISKIKELLNQEKERHIWSKIKSLEKKLSRLSRLSTNQDDIISQDKINQLRDEIKTMKQSIDIYKCPSCQRSLRYLRGNLVLSETSPVPLDRINNLQEELVEQEHKYHEQEERKNLKVQLDSLYSTVTTTYSSDSGVNVKKLERELHDLQRLTFPQRPSISGQVIKQAREYYQLKEELDQTILDLSHYSNVIMSEEVTTSVLLKILDRNQKKLKQLNETLSRRESLKNQIKSYQQDLSKYDNVSYTSKELQSMIDQQRQTEEKLNQCIKDDQLAQEYLLLKKQEQETLIKFQRLDKELSSALRLRDIAKQEICEIIEEKITYVNSLISDIAQRIFHDPITVELSLLKTTKTTKTTKPYVHLKIVYRNDEYDSLHQLSGGEGKRISLAISLALSLVNSFPMILLDECLNGLDDELKELSLNILKEMSENKTIVCIMHDGVTGYYDKIIDLIK